jgi:cell wall-associated NlpC family hydrolase
LANAEQGAHFAPTATRGRLSGISRPFRLTFLAAMLAITAIAVEMPAATQAHGGRYGHSDAQRIVRLLRSHIGAKFQLGANGPRRFDCSGLVYNVYKHAGLASRIGGQHTAAGYYYWFKKHHAVSRHNPKVGDIVVWKEKGKIAHSGIYVGHGHVISALINPWGVKRTHINTIHARFFAFLHVRISH